VIAAILQARMSSRRLPGKVLRPLNGKPTLQYIVERLEHCGQLDGFLIATSVEPDDDAIAEFCAEHGVDCHRGPLEDVALRFVEASRERGLDAFARLTGDSPLLDQGVVDRAVELFRSGDFDLVTNVFPRSFPRGQSVEVVRTASFPELSDPLDREHVTRHFYEHEHGFRIQNLERTRDASDLQLALDTEEDAAVIERILSSMERPHWEYDSDAIVALHREIA
jgi:spore coat polysaccharide biosynthesis protein SpsF